VRGLEIKAGAQGASETEGAWRGTARDGGGSADKVAAFPFSIY
jgi:hypothetical protein